MKNFHVPVEKKSLSFVHHNANQVRTVYNGHIEVPGKRTQQKFHLAKKTKFLIFKLLSLTKMFV